ncbi:hypothetical protein [Fluviicola sp.]|jgi:hypothetical protein|uniref:hypothetical protein n=1 Tax=Fluviicola sp. TaxID=1917219 RepID=UPI00281816B8|nr:hypothetical protein [Fluviicola sp.]MDR0801901.1 hypothetical protein [Fluviicola sp.]
MNVLCLMLVTLINLFSISTFSQTTYSTIASNRIIQKHHSPERITKIAQIDPERLQVLWDYFSNSFSFSTNESGFTVEELLNIQQFDVSEYEHLRKDNSPVQFVFRGSIQITLKSGQELSNLLQGYNPNSLLNELPVRLFPGWTSTNFTQGDFENYKKQIWEWAKDYPEAYIQLTSDLNRLHIHFQEWQNLEDSRRTQILNEMDYLIIE